MAEDVVASFRLELNKLKADVADFKRQMGVAEKSAKDAGSKTQSAFNKIGDSVKGIGAGIIAAFSVQAVIAFGQECIRAFQEAEKAARILQSAVSVNGGIGKDFQNLLDQASELQKRTIFSDDQIMQVQTAALQFGLTAEEVEKLIPVITDFASATGKDLTSAFQAVTGGVNGNARALKQYGVSLAEGVSRTEQLNNITEQLNKKFQGQAQIIAESTGSGRASVLANQLDEVKESIGAMLSEMTTGVGTMISFALNGFEPVNEESSELTKNLFANAEQVKKFTNAMLNAQIALLEQQAAMAGSGKAAEELNKQLQELKDQRFELEIQGISDEELNSRIAAIKNTTFVLQDQSNVLRLLEAEYKKRNLNALIFEKDLTNLTLSELEKRKAALEEANKETNSLALQDAIDSVEKEIEIRKKQDEKRKEAAIKAKEDALKLNEEMRQKAIEQGDELIKQEAVERIKSLNQLELTERERQIRLTKIEIEGLEQRLSNYEVYGKETGDVQLQILSKQEELRKQLSAPADEIHPGREEWDKMNEEFFIPWEEKEKQRVQDSVDLFQDLIAQYAGVFDQFSQMNIERLQNERQQNEDAATEEEDRLRQQFDQRVIGQAEYEKRLQQVKDKREQGERALDERIRKAKARQLAFEKAQALFTIPIQTAQAIMATAKNLGFPLAIPFIAAMGALGALQLAAVISQQPPKAHTGERLVKRKGEGYGLKSDETLRTLQVGERVVDRHKNRKHWSVYEAIEDGKLEDYVYRYYVAPRLKEQQRQFEKARHKALTDSMATSILSQGGGADNDELIQFLRKRKLKVEVTNMPSAAHYNPYRHT